MDRIEEELKEESCQVESEASKEFDLTPRDAQITKKTVDSGPVLRK